MINNRILIIDDDARNIFALSLVLRARGYHCIPASQAQEGLNLLKENQEIGIVLLDMMMPEMDGYQTLHRIRQDQQLKDLPIIAVTAQAMSGDREKCIQAGASDYISKPIDVDALESILNRFLK